MKDLVSWSAQRCHWCGETFRGPIFTAARRCSGVDVPADDPLHNGARQHDEAVRELQGETVGDLIVEARLRWDGHSVSGFSGFFHHGKHGKQYQVLGNFHRFHSKDAADLRRQEGSPESHQCMTWKKKLRKTAKNTTSSDMDSYSLSLDEKNSEESCRLWRQNPPVFNPVFI